MLDKALSVFTGLVLTEFAGAWPEVSALIGPVSTCTSFTHGEESATAQGKRRSTDPWSTLRPCGCRASLLIRAACRRGPDQ